MPAAQHSEAPLRPAGHTVSVKLPNPYEANEGEVRSQIDTLVGRGFAVELRILRDIIDEALPPSRRD